MARHVSAASLGDEIAAQRRNNRAMTVGIVVLFLAVLAGGGAFAWRDRSRGLAVASLSANLDALREQVKFCDKHPRKRDTPRCTVPAAPSADTVIDAVPGPVGPIGPTGVAGPAGPRGQSGTRGDQGSTGQQGAGGKPGNTGLQGIPGLQGIQGPAGPPGDKGAPGDKGEKGDTGPAGFPASFTFTYLLNSYTCADPDDDHAYECVAN